MCVLDTYMLYTYVLDTYVLYKYALEMYYVYCINMYCIYTLENNMKGDEPDKCAPPPCVILFKLSVNLPSVC